ncbi:MAG: nucleotidyl transferase AbiEii/AbiGii toxin family protein [Myxococcales bacterium]|nr:nucleotidyl transferase AbiEii/AbiGii toxin family protein [Myxococcales bacterium]
MNSTLSPIQLHVLGLLGHIIPRWTLTGGGALAGFHLGHRTTKDVDLFFHGEATLGDLPRKVRGLLTSAGLNVESVQEEPAFCRLRVVSAAAEVLLVDLVAEPVANATTPERRDVGGTEILVDTPLEILGNKLCALYSRWEIRDLVDVRALLDAGVPLEAGLQIAATKDGGFGRADLAWALQRMKVAALAAAEGYDGPTLAAFATRLTTMLLQAMSD